MLLAPPIAEFTSAEEYERRDEINALVADALKLRSNAAWTEVLTRHKIWHSPVNDYASVVEDPQVVHNRSFVTVAGATGTPITLVNHPVMYDGKTPEVRLPPQAMGAQTDEILAEIGYSAAEIAALEEQGVVARQLASPGMAKA